ncbi:hypothetical protein V6N11_055939 [Hibiscus sabdariffa]|uniref:Reverse transcriptase zinc-binding domain-containing protein n=1 Tax=Hibiscus sabdariffa TaxID=183260 RepID=A0ABR2T2C9_9ROSI
MQRVKIISKFRGIPRIQLFLWLCYHGSILTNGERHCHHLIENLSCSICGAAVEDVSHLIRGCVKARSLRPRLIKKDKSDEILLMEHKIVQQGHRLMEESLRARLPARCGHISAPWQPSANARWITPPLH